MDNKQSGFSPDYQTGRSVCNVISIFGWIAVVLGFVLAYIRAFSVQSENLVNTLLAATPGLMFVVTGFLNIALAQIGVATIDNANANREILYLKKQSRNTE